MEDGGSDNDGVEEALQDTEGDDDEDDASASCDDFDEADYATADD